MKGWFAYTLLGEYLRAAGITTETRVTRLNWKRARRVFVLERATR